MERNKVPYALLIGIEDQLANIFNTKQEIIDITKYFAKSINKRVPISEAGNETKQEILRQNIDCFSDDEIFDFISQLKKISFIKCENYLCEEIDELLEYQASEIHNSKSRETIRDLLNDYPSKIKNQWSKACRFFDKGEYRESLDSIRLSLELLVKNITRADKSLENQKKNLGNFFKAKGISSQITNLFLKMLNMYEKIQNDKVKHDVPEDLNCEEIAFLMNQASTIIKFLIACDKKGF